MKKATTFEDLVIAAERATRKAAAIDAAKKAMSGIAWAEPDVNKAVVLLDKAKVDLEAQIVMIQDSLIAEKKGGHMRLCPVCNRIRPRSDMLFTHDCHGITFRLVCWECYQKVMAKGYDGEYYTDADEQIEDDY